MTSSSSFPIVVFLLVAAGQCLPAAVSSAGCEPIRLPMCAEMKYNMTQMPNLLHHSAQENARLSIEQFQDLVNTNCSDLLLFFLCTMYAPICTRSLEFEVEAIPPCKGVCVEARLRCEPTMLRYNVTWPDYLSCQHLPEYTRGVCLTPEAIVDTMPDDDDDDDAATPITYSQESDVITETGEVSETITSPKMKRKGSCKKCDGTLNKVSQGVFVDRAFEYVVRAQVESFRTVGENLMYTTIMVREVLKYSDITIPIGEVHLVTEGPCVCPKLTAGVEYVIMCYQDLDSGYLRLTDTCIAQEWTSENWSRLVKKWNKKLRRSEEQVLSTSGYKRRRGRSRHEPTEAPARGAGKNRDRNRDTTSDFQSVSDSPW